METEPGDNKFAVSLSYRAKNVSKNNKWTVIETLKLNHNIKNIGRWWDLLLK